MEAIMSSRDRLDADLLATRRAWLALEGWTLVKLVPATKGNAEHAVMRRDDEWRCSCADFVYRERKRGGVCRHITDAGGKGTNQAATLPTRPAPGLTWKPEEGGLEELLSASVRPGVLWIPECWDWFLDGEMPTPSKQGPARSPDDPSPCRGDYRRATVRVKEYVVEARLRSGPTNYWINWAVVQGTRTLYEGTADGRADDVDFGIPGTATLPLPDGTELTVEIQRYRTERTTRRRRGYN